MPSPQGDVQDILYQLERTEREIQLLSAPSPQLGAKTQNNLSSSVEKVKRFLLEHSSYIEKNSAAAKKKYVDSYMKWINQTRSTAPDSSQTSGDPSNSLPIRFPKQYDALKFDLSSPPAQNNPQPCKKWSEHDRKLFVHQYLAFPKRFHKIASNLSLKTSEDCVLYYYQRKKQLHLKQKLFNRQPYIPSRTHYLGEK